MILQGMWDKLANLKSSTNKMSGSAEQMLVDKQQSNQVSKIGKKSAQVSAKENPKVSVKENKPEIKKSAPAKTVKVAKKSAAVKPVNKVEKVAAKTGKLSKKN